MDIRTTISNLPKLPGVYQFFNSQGSILYIGKAKNLKSRVSSYFSLNTDSFKTRKLASQIAEVRHIVVETEADALLLENNLIKEFQPKYNILLKDDKTFPWICIKSEPFPRIFSLRNRVKDGSEYFGPYTSAYMVKTLLGLVRQLYQIRTCSHLLTAENIQAQKFKVCLEHHIGNCQAPCIGQQTSEDYLLAIEQIREILKGNLQQVQDYLYELMLSFSNKMQFEEAEKLKQKYELLNRYKSKSTIVNPKIHNVDVYSYIQEEDAVYINFLKIINGAIVQSHTVELTCKLDETKEELLSFAIFDIRQKVFSNSLEAIIPFEIESFQDIRFIVPQKGDKKKLLELSERNARQYAHQKNISRSEIAERYNKSSILELVRTDLRLKELPAHIECFDNSNIQGTSPVAACVVFLNGKPAKKEYRHFHIKTVKGPNDFASMEEIVYRRYKRMIDEGKTLPQLIVIDGGKGQLSAAVTSLQKLNIYGQIAVLGIAKRLEEIYFPGDSIPLYLDKNSKTLKLIQHMRNEAHRFGISFHRTIRSKEMLKNSLLEIEGVGEKTFTKLMKAFGSIETLKEKSVDEITEVVPANVAANIYKFLNT